LKTLLHSFHHVNASQRLLLNHKVLCSVLPL